MLKKIKKKIARFLFPKIFRDFEFDLVVADIDLKGAVAQTEELKETIDALKAIHKMEVSRLKEELETQPAPKMSDLMIEILGGYVANISTVEKDGFPKHFLDLDDKDKRLLYVNELAMIYQTTVWKIMCDYHIDTQGNHIIRHAEDEKQMLFGRATINGISLLRNDVLTGFQEYQEGRKPTEEFDEFELSEGIPMKVENILKSQG